MAERTPRIGTVFPIAFTLEFDRETPNVITAGQLYVYDSTPAAIAGSPFTASVQEITANTKYRVHYDLVTAGLAAGDYTGRMVYTTTQPIDDDEFAFYLLPVTSKYDRWVNRVRRLLRQSGLSESQATLSYRDLMDALNTAVAAYSQNRPRVVEWEQVLTAGDWTYALPAGWVLGVSRIIEGEYPQDVTVQSRPYLGISDVRVDEADLLLYFTRHEPSAGEAARFLYTGLYTLDHTTDNLPAAQFEAIAHAAAAEACRMLAIGAAGSDGPEIAAQVVNYRDMTARYQALAQLLSQQAQRLWRSHRYAL